MDRSLLKSKKAQARSKPSQMVNKSISMLMDIDTGIIGKLSDTEKDKLHTQLQKLTTAVSTIQETIQDEPTAEIMPEQPAAAQARPVPNKVKRLFVSQTRPDSPFVYCRNQNLSITNLGFTLEFAMFKYSQQQGDSADCIAYFITEAGDELCPLQEFHVESGGIAKVGFTLKANASSEKCCFLVIKSPKDKFDEAQQIIRFEIKMLFSTGFDF